MNSVLEVGGASSTTFASDQPSSFRQRLAYYRELCRTGSPPQAWQSTAVETTHNYLRFAIGSAIVELKNIAILERNGVDHHDRAQAVKSTVDYIKMKTEDHDFRQTFADLGRLFRELKLKESGKVETPELQLLRFQSTGLQTLELLQSIVECQNTMQGIDLHNSVAIAARLLSGTESAGRPVDGLWYYRDAYYCHLPLCGMVLTPEEPYECTVLVKWKLINHSCLGSRGTGRLWNAQNFKDVKIMVEIEDIRHIG
jgi:hypothetical protein